MKLGQNHTLNKLRNASKKSKTKVLIVALAIKYSSYILIIFIFFSFNNNIYILDTLFHAQVEFRTNRAGTYRLGPN